MPSGQSLREFINKRLSAAAEEIFTEFQRNIVLLEEEIDRQRKLLDLSWKPQIHLHRIELPQHYVWRDEEVLTDQQLCNQEGTSSLGQEEPETLQEGPEPSQIKVEQDDPEHLQILEQQEFCICQEEQFVLKLETVTSLVTPTYEEQDHNEPEPTCDQLSMFPHAEVQEQESSRKEDAESSSDEEMKRNQRCPQTRDHRGNGDCSELEMHRNTHTEPAMATFFKSSHPQDDDFWEFLKKREIALENIHKMQQDRIDSSVVGELDDGAMAAYIPAYGDRIAIRRFCREKISTNRNQENNHNTGEDSTLRPTKWYLRNNKRALKMTRKVEIGWIHENRQVRKRCGGGTKFFDISKKATKADILSLAKKQFFPNDKSSKGMWEDFSHDVVDFKGHLDEIVSVGELYETHKLGLLRFYLLTMNLPVKTNCSLKKRAHRIYSRDAPIRCVATDRRCRSSRVSIRDTDDMDCT